MKRALVWGLGGIAVMTLGAIAVLWASSVPQPVAAPTAPETTALAPAPSLPPPPASAAPSAAVGEDVVASVAPGGQPDHQRPRPEEQSAQGPLAPAPDPSVAGVRVLSPEEIATREEQHRARLEAHRTRREATLRQREEHGRKRAADRARRPPDPNRPALDLTPLKLGPAVIHPEAAEK